MMVPTFLASVVSSAQVIRIEAEDGRPGPQVVANHVPGFSGTGYVTGFQGEHAPLEIDFDAKAGVYEVRVIYHASQRKGYAMTVNGRGLDGMFKPSTGFAIHRGGRVELVDGPNTLTLGGGWGYYDIDAIEFELSGPLAPPQPVSAEPVNPNASSEARALLARLASVYGRGTLSGTIKDQDNDLVVQITGRTPAMMGGDLMDYSPSRVAHGADPQGETERLIRAAARGQIITLCWHWNAPTDLIDATTTDASGNEVNARWYKGFYSNATTFDFARALDDPESEGYQLLMRDIDAIAVELKKLEDAGVPVLWRPLHESDGGWFWWGTRGPENFKRLWRLLYDRLTVHHGLNNLLWVYTIDDVAWYPGDDVVDLVGMDVYVAHTNDTMFGRWERMLSHFDGRKMIALTECGGMPDIEAMQSLGVWWVYANPWTGNLGPAKNDRESLQATMSHAGTINLDE
jgi:mannan endo-1,4-beta-mannosidase